MAWSQRGSSSRGCWLPWLACFVGCAYALLLVTRAQRGVFFSGDGGLKALMAKQYARTGLFGMSLQLTIPAEPWVVSLWDEGLYPFEPPFVYRVGSAHYIAFPPLFSMLTAPFLEWFGWRGLYALPLFGVWATLAGVVVICSRLRIDPIASAIAVSAAGLASPLAPYGAAYWEHSLALGLGTIGMATLTKPADSSAVRGLLAGVLGGLASVLRPEILLFFAVLVGGFMAFPGDSTLRKQVSRAVASCSVCVGLFAVLNLYVSGSPLGLHGRQVMTAYLGPLVPGTAARALLLYFLLASYFPLALVAPFVWLVPRDPPIPSMRRLVVSTMVFALLLPFFVPNDGGLQWGPRYLLVLVPVGSVATSAALAKAGAYGSRVSPLVAILIAAVAIGIGVSRNTVAAPYALDQLYHYRAAFLEFVTRQPEPFIAVTLQDWACDLTELIPRRTFFRVGRPGQARGRMGVAASPELIAPDACILTHALRGRGIRGYLLVASADDPISPAPRCDELQLTATPIFRNRFSAVYRVQTSEPGDARSSHDR
jgi:hypothetical protein